eukprot:31353-Eustigmatos_ZCMA.PRE.1
MRRGVGAWKHGGGCLWLCSTHLLTLLQERAKQEGSAATVIQKHIRRHIAIKVTLTSEIHAHAYAQLGRIIRSHAYTVRSAGGCS